jgi:hypothetical protein
MPCSFKGNIFLLPKRLKLNGAKKRNKRKCAHHYFSVVSAWRALKYHHHLRARAALRSFIPTPNPTPKAKPVARMFMLEKSSIMVLAAAAAARAIALSLEREEQRKLMKRCGDKAAQQTPSP